MDQVSHTSPIHAKTLIRRKALVVTHRAHAGADGAGGHQNNFATSLSLSGELRHQLLKLGQVRLFATICQYTCPDFDYEAGGIFE